MKNKVKKRILKNLLFKIFMILTCYLCFIFMKNELEGILYVAFCAMLVILLSALFEYLTWVLDKE